MTTASRLSVCIYQSTRSHIPTDVIITVSCEISNIVNITKSLEFSLAIIGGRINCSKSSSPVHSGAVGYFFFRLAGRVIEAAFLSEIMTFENITFIEFLPFLANFIKLRTTIKGIYFYLRYLFCCPWTLPSWPTAPLTPFLSPSYAPLFT